MIKIIHNSIITLINPWIFTSTAIQNPISKSPAAKIHTPTTPNINTYLHKNHLSKPRHLDILTTTIRAPFLIKRIFQTQTIIWILPKISGNICTMTASKLKERYKRCIWRVKIKKINSALSGQKLTNKVSIFSTVAQIFFKEITPGKKIE